MLKDDLKTIPNPAEKLSRGERRETDDVKSTVSLLQELRQLGVTISLNEAGDRLQVAAPRGAVSEELRLQLAERKEAVLDFLRQVRAGAETAGAEARAPLTAVPRPADGRLPLSFAQSRLFFLYQWMPQSAAYNVANSFSVRGALDVGVLTSSLREIVRRHESLRTRFVVEGSEPVQVVEEEPRFVFRRVDLSGLDEAARLPAGRALLGREARRPFNLFREPLLRVLLLELGDEERLLTVNLHHIVSDGWSMNVLTREMVELYGAFSEGRPSPLPELSLQYGDFALWQRQQLQGERVELELSYWRRRLAGAGALDLPLDRPRPPKRSFRGGVVDLPLTPELYAGTEAVARRHDATFFMVLLAALDLVLSRYTGQQDLLVGTPVAGRERSEIEGLIGFFVNTLVLRVDASGDPTVQEFLARVREVTFSAFAHQDLPFEKVVEEVRPERDPSASPLFQVLLAFDNVTPTSWSLPGVTLQALQVRNDTAKFDLTLMISATAVVLEYDRDVFTATTAARLVGHFYSALASFSGDPEQRISRLSLLSPAERHQLLTEWTDRLAVSPLSRALARLFEEQADATPDAVAVAEESSDVSYRELDAWSNRLAHLLLQKTGGLRPETPVGLYLDRSAELVAGILAVLKAGGAYLPLDLDYPEERLRFMVEDSGAPLVVSRGELARRLSGFGCRTLDLEAAEEELASAPESRLPERSGGAHLAYLIYTSGSTGIPKAVAVPQAAVVRLVRNTSFLPFSASERIAQVSNTTFDAATFEIWGALLNGGRLEVIDRSVLLDPEAFSEALRRRGVSALFLTTAMVHLMAQVKPDGFSSLRHLLAGGEALSPRWFRRILEAGSPERLFNVYGPTEATTFATFHRIRSVPRGAPSIPIGRAISNTTLYVVDARGEACPPGVWGELYLGGPGLARGYHARPALTAAAFVPDALSGARGERLYRTGDRVRVFPDGNVDCAGRFDHQVKLRGFRVELGEVETALGRHPGVGEAAVTLHEDEPGEKRLVAWVKLTDPALSAARLREDLGRELPEYMVPSAFEVVEEMPLGPTGKLDRSALARRTVSVKERAVRHRPAGSPTEEMVLEVWREVFADRSVGTDDDFFALGGHSLLAVQVVSRLQQSLGVEVPLQELFAHPTVVDLAARLDTVRRGGEGALLVAPIVPVGRDRPLPLSFAQHRLWIFEELELNLGAYNVSFAAELAGALDVAALEKSFEEVVRRHEVLRTVFAWWEAEPVQEIDPPDELVLPVVDLSALPSIHRERELGRQMGFDATRRFDLTLGPLLALTLLRLAPERHALLVSMHHVVSDAWSTEVLLRELGAIYGAFRERRPSPLPELPVQYADYAVWQREVLSGETLEKLLGFWKERLADVPGIDLPTDRPRPARPSFRGRALPVTFDTPLAERLRRLSRERRVTLNMTMLAAWNALLGRFTGQERIVLGTPTANRNHPETEGLIGFFVNDLVLVSDLGGNPTFAELLARVRQATLTAHDHQELPFEMLVEALDRPREIDRHPLFQVVFQLLHAPAAAALPGLELRYREVEVEQVKFDLGLNLAAGEELSGWMDFATDLFDVTTARRLVSGYRTLLAAAAEDPETRLEELSFLSVPQRHQVLAEWQGERRSRGPSALQLVEDVAGRLPDALAVTSSSGALSFGELDRLASRLAGRLRRLGVTAEEVVGVALERRPEWVVACLAVWKAGGAYLPLDLSYPPLRLRYLLEDSGTRVVVTDAEHGAALQGEWTVLTYEEEPEDGAPEPVRSEPVREDPLAYVIYTSGSTGRPKGVEVSHGALASFLTWHGERFATGVEDRVCQVGSPGFDVSVCELWAHLARGTSVYLVDEESRRFPARLRDELVAAKVTLGFLATPLVEAFLELDWPPETALRRLNAGGDRLRRRPGPAIPFEVINNYGPTETTVLVTSGTVSRRGAAQAHPDVGRPITGVTVRVVDRRLRLQGVAVPGELLVGGGSLARGYRRRPALTARVFVPDPWSTVPGARLYRTGDLVRSLADGRLDFVGRLDHQVQLLGVRVEPGEVEAVLHEHPDLRDAVVVVREDAGELRLVAYVVPRAEEVSNEDLRVWLGERLPASMVPSVLVSLEALPLDAHGKLDRAALPDPLGDDTYEAPSGPVEELLALVWQRLLGKERIGVRDDFFSLGGHSLLATQVVSAVSDVFGVSLPLRSVFETPTIAALAAEIDSARHRASGVEPAALAIPRLPRPLPAEGVPLSFAQRRLWFLERLAPGNSFYNSSANYWMDGELDVAGLWSSLTGVVRRHEVLRTVYQTGAPPTQVVRDANLRPVLVDLSGLGPERGRAEGERLAAALSRRPFDLTADLMLRAVLLRLGAEQHGLLLTFHHIAFDGWSWPVFLEDLVGLYEHHGRAGAAALPELPIQYADFAVWQNETLAGESLERLVGYWQKQLDGAPTLELPTDRPRPSVQRFRGGSESFTLPAELAPRLRELDRQSSTTLFMTLKAVFDVLLWRMTGQQDLVAGTPVANRNRVETERLVGFFVNSLVLRTRLPRGAATPFAELLAQVRETTLDAGTYQDLPFEKLVEQLLRPGEAERDMSRNPIFQVMFAVRSSVRPVRMTGLRMDGVGGETSTTRFDLEVQVTEGSAGLELDVVYDRDLFHATTAARLVRYYARLLVAVVEQADRPIGELPLLSAAERHQLLKEWTDRLAVSPLSRALARLFEEQADATPDAVAVAEESSETTYRELDAWSNRLAHLLLQKTGGLRPETPVGLYLDRSTELVAGILAVLKAGGAYLPLDLDYPAERLRFMVEDSGAPLVVSRGDLARRLSELGCRTLDLEAEEEELASAPESRLPEPGGGSHLAYLIYTSGSTGVPKAVAVPQAAVVRLVRNTSFLPFSASERIAQVSNTTFDAATFEIWGALLNGGRLEVIERSVLLRPKAFSETLRRREVSAMFLTAAMAHLMAQVKPDGFSSLRHLLAGGEALSPRWMRRILEAGAPERLLNGYGPTECTTFAAWHHVTAVPRGAGSVPIGRAISNTTLYVADARGDLCPPGVWGELYVGGPGLARGYHARPALTAAVFVPDALSGARGERLYRTGDRVRSLPDGSIDCSGRFDHQVKLRGFRIELGEVETALGRHPGVAQAVVALDEDESGEKRLVAWVQRTDAALSAARLREDLGRELPEYMVPSVFEVLEELPLGPTGKLDRSALARRAVSVQERAVRQRPAGSPLEEMVLEVWREVFADRSVGTDDDFFALGGHSLLAVQVVSRLQQALGVEVPLQELFAHPNVADLAARLEAVRRGGESVAVAPVVPVGRDRPLPLSFTQHRLWIFGEMELDLRTYNVPFAAELIGALDVAALEKTFDEILRRHEILRTVFAWWEADPVQEIDPPDDLVLPVVDLAALPPAARELELERQVGIDAMRHFDLTLGPLFALTLLRLAPERHALLVNMHHVVSDAWSMGIFLREVETLYSAFRERRPSPLPDLPVQYADYAVWQREVLAGASLDRLLSYWKGQVEDAPPSLDLPADRPRPARPSFRGRNLSFHLEATLSERLRQLGRDRRATLNMTMLAAWNALLGRLTSQRKIVLGTPNANRNRPEVEGLIGFFVNDLVLVTDLGGDPSFEELLRRVTETSLAASDHQDLPFEMLVESLGRPHDLDRHPLFQVAFQLLHAPESVSLPGLEARPLHSDVPRSKFDLLLGLVTAANEIDGGVSFATDLFDETTVRRLVDHYLTLLRGVVEDPGCRLSRLALLGATEKHQLLVEWQGRPSGGAAVPAHVRIERFAHRQPQALAVAGNGKRWSFAELLARADRLAVRLRALGVGPEARVGVCLERTPEMVAAMLGVWRAGGAYVPLDATHPAARLRYMMGDAGVRWLVTDASRGAELAGEWTQLCPDGAATELAPATAVEGWNVAYMIYTSGSTGRPKGVEVSFGALASFVAWWEESGIGPGDRGTQVCSPGFDGSVWDLWAQLALGTSIHLADEETRLSPRRLYEWMLAEEIDASFLPTVLAEQVLGFEWPATGRPRIVYCGGDRLRRRPAPEIPFPLVNIYGPTETTILVAAGTVGRPGSAAARGTVHPDIGRPITGARLYVADRRLRAQPIGVPGELLISGPSLARGYCRRQGLTAERFVPEPWSGRPGERAYRTGDLVRTLGDGRIDFLGRIDHQVQLHGIRIELGEVEAVLQEHPRVRDAVVVAREEADAPLRLVAYAVLEDEETTREDLRAWLGEHLPASMVPSQMVLLDALPMTAHGKLDRDALPAPSGGDVYTAPRGPVEELLALLWQRLLGRERISVHDDFFTLGGHSLLATQVVSGVRELFGVTLPLRLVFEAPTIAAQAARIASLRHLGGEEADDAAAFTIPRLPRPLPATGLPLSFAQGRLWFLERLAPGHSFYNSSFNYWMEGELDVSALQASLADVVRRHEVLRTVFRSGGPDAPPVQVVCDAGLRPALVDLSALSQERAHAEGERLATAENRRPFDLTADLMLRATLLRLHPDRHGLLLTFHHIAFDGWSWQVFLEEMTQHYERHSRPGAGSPLPELPIQYADFAVWQHETLSGRSLERLLRFWRQQLDGTPTLELPTDRPRPTIQRFRGGAESLVLPAGLTPRLRELDRRRSTTLFMTLKAVFDVLLWRVTGQQDLVVGTPVANRTRAETERLIGFFVNTLVLRTRLPDGAATPFTELLTQARETTLDASTHQDLPFEKLVEHLLQPGEAGRDTSRNPIFQVMFAVRNRVRPAQMGSLKVGGVGGAAATTRFDLEVQVEEGDEGLVLQITYDRDLFHSTTVARLVRYYARLLTAVVEQVETPIGGLPLFSAAERQQLLVEWQGRVPHAAAPAAHVRIERFARRQPDAPAVFGNGKRLSFAELVAQADRLAVRLRSLGVGPEKPVGVCLERTPEMVVAMLGIWRAGGAYVPLDVTYPAARLRFMLDDAGIRWLVTDTARGAELTGDWALLHPDATTPGSGPADPVPVEPAPPTAVDASNLAYVIYTSGSTGRPKGVEVSFGALASFVAWWEELGIGPGDHATQVCSPGFDVSVWELWGQLALGTGLHLVDEETRRDPRRLRDWLLAEEVDASFLPTVLAEQVLAFDWPAVCRLRAVFCGGDRLRRRPAPQVPFPLVNIYGPTEGTILVTTGTVAPRGSAASRDTVHPDVGRPITGVRIYVADRRLSPQPIGVPGELLIAGRSLARGYRQRPAMTAERFVPEPWSGGRGERLYRTGDLVRTLGDGRIDFLGRLDHQVQIHGVRVELGEIEAVLQEHPRLRDAVVVAHEEADAPPRLVAYVVPRDEGATDEDLRDWLGERLPASMVPSQTTFLDALPVNPHGKLDRAALPAPTGGGDVYTAPRGPVEELLALLWQRLLGRERIGVHDDFFALGGHSLLAAQVVSGVRELFGVEIPLQALFEKPTVARLARRVGEATPSRLPPITPAPRPEAAASPEGLPLSFAQERLWFLHRLVPRSPAYNVPGALRLEGPLDVPRMFAALRSIVRRHEVLRTVFLDVDGRPLQRFVPALEPELTWVELAGLGEEDRRRELQGLVTWDAERPFDLARGPLVRMLLVRLSSADHVVVFNMHHIVSDGWSLRVLLGELSSFYRGESPPPLAVQYADFAVWQRGWLHGELLERELGYWREQLAGVPFRLELPADRPRPPVQSFRGAMLPLRWPASLGEALVRSGRQHGATLFMTLLAGFQVWLSRVSNQPDLLVGTPIAGRQHREIEGLIGFFVNTLILRGDLRDDPTFEEHLRRVRDQALDAYGHQDVPFEQLVETLKPERDLSRQPLFQVMLTLQHEPLAGLELQELRLRPLDQPGRTAKFDLTLLLQEEADGLGGGLEYDTALFDATTAQRMARSLEALVEGLVGSPGLRAADAPLLPAVERHQLVAEWNDTVAVYGEEHRLHVLFEAQVDRNPDAPALLFETADGTPGRWSYRQLEERANQLAAHLRGLGVGPDMPVALCVERSPEMVVGIFAILKAGGAYVPLDPGYPPERLAYMAESSQARVLLTCEGLLPLLQGCDGPRRVCFDLDADRIAAAPRERRPAAVTGDNLAYVIYTSGSTGAPKGAMNSHRAVVNRVLWMQEAYGLTGEDRVLQKTPFSFDVSVWEFFWPLLTGAALVVARPGGHQDPAYLARRIRESEVTTIHFVPSMLRAFLEEPTAAPAPSLRRVIASGEALPADLVAGFYARFDCGLHNLYGPTEAAVDVTAWPCDPVADATGNVPIGRPIKNLAIRLLDRRMRPVGVAVAAELMIGGVGLARGYLGRPALTAERFVPDPLSPSAGRRLYRTGDLARHRGGGEIEFLGRIDHQVKLRGFRIELGEIEAALAAHPGVHQAVVSVLGEGEARHLVAWVVPEEASAGPLRRLLELREEEQGPSFLELPNGLEVAHLNRSETEFTYREHFEDRSYFRHGVELGTAPVVFDVGANVGLFALSVLDERPDARVYAFEPVPKVYEALATNARIYPGLLPRCVGLSAEAGEASFEWYPHASVLSGRFADPEAEREVVRAYLENEAGDLPPETLDEMVNERLVTETVRCELRTVSDVLREEGVERVDLLKVDVEKSEMEVLAGIAEDDWPRIGQVVVEVHDLDGRLAAVRRLLEERGFEVADEQDPALRRTDLYCVYARRPDEDAAGAVPESVGGRFWRLASWQEDLRRQLAERLPEYMVPAVFVPLPALPLLPNGKVNRRALPSPETLRRTRATVAPRDVQELHLARLFAELLDVDEVGRDDDFFSLGGHSLLGVRLLNRVREELGVRLSVVDLFRNPTVESLARRLREGGAAVDSVLVPLRSHGARRPLFLVHGADGSAGVFVPLAQELDREQPVYAFQSAELLTAEESGKDGSSVAEMAERYLGELREVQASGPYQLGGWSMGGLVALEMACRLRAAGEEVSLLALFDTHLHPSDGSVTRAARWASFAYALGIQVETDEEAVAQLAEMDDEKTLAALAELGRHQGVLSEHDGDRLRRLYDAYQANLQAWNGYEAVPYDAEVRYFAAAPSPEDGTESPLGGLIVKAEVREAAGDHFTMLRQPHVKALAEELTNLLES